MAVTNERIEADPDVLNCTAPTLQDLLVRVQGEYREMPGLSLTAAQAQRLWQLDRETCAFLLATLTENRFVRQTRSGAYVRV